MVIQNGTLPINALAPGDSQILAVPMIKPAVRPAGAEYYVRIIGTLNHDTLWAEAGYVLAWDQFKVPWQVPVKTPATHTGTLSVQPTTSAYIVTTSHDVTVTIDRTTGTLSSYVVDGREMVTSPLVPNFWRVPTDNDRGNGMPSRQGIWKTAGPDRTVTAVELTQVTNQSAQIRVQDAIPAGDTSLETFWTIYGDGDVHVTCNLNVDPNQQDLPRFGMQMEIPGDFNNVQWFGRGPQETYWDRQTGAAIGVYASTVQQWVHAYVRPQENGNRTNVRWFTLTDAAGRGLRFTADDLLYVSAWPYTMATLEAAAHINDLISSGRVTVNVDDKQMGVGGDNSWGARTHPEYRLEPGAYSYGFNIAPLRP